MNKHERAVKAAEMMMDGHTRKRVMEELGIRDHAMKELLRYLSGRARLPRLVSGYPYIDREQARANLRFLEEHRKRWEEFDREERKRASLEMFDLNRGI